MSKEKTELSYRPNSTGREMVISDGKIIEVDSEPGDGTRYRYLLIPVRKQFYVVSHITNMTYPRKVEIWEAKNDNYQKLADRYDCNPYTAEEVIRAIKELINDKEDKNE